MPERFTLALEKLRQHPRRLTAGEARPPAGGMLPERRLGLMFAAGDEVIDLVTGQKGTVIVGTRETVVVPVAEG